MILDFVMNGGLVGAMRGFDHNKEGHCYSFNELAEDVQSISDSTGKISQSMASIWTQIPGQAASKVLKQINS